ncbi:WD repeat-containing protein KIAA1875 [Acipenser ruthenus]|uniref:WD repeat-containing protein KIAA1875 n=1 Tax=Acipenser ruthenus TaxID=7906 RepID=A0A662YSQ4_ACIRT|nr:WD repeat-containing protein KIAA1875 [Acipenser ruthenus]
MEAQLKVYPTGASGLSVTSRFITGIEGGSVSVQCHYDRYLNTNVKYWCSGKVWSSCKIIQRSTVKQRDEDKISISDDRTQGVFTVTVRRLEKKDSGWYWCGIQRAGTDEGIQLNLSIDEDLGVSMELVKHSCFNPTLTTHGIQHICHFSSNSPVRHVTYNQATGDFVSLSSDGTLRVYQCEGRLRASFPSAEPFSGIASTVLPDRYAAWGPGNRLAVLDREFRTISSTCSSQDIHTCLSKEGVYELVVGGAGHVSVWCLRHLVCRVKITEGLGTRDVFTELVLPKAASPKSQRCFAMSSAGVALFHLSKGMLLAYKKDLHLCNITGIAYCNTAKSLATASRDGTIKVWDEDWGVQMVFAGHTGAVTALAACPHLPHFFSSSLDGTLRVWSLETGDQLEKIHTGPALGLGMKSTEKDGVERLGKKASRLLCSYSRKGVDFWALTHLYALHTPLGGAPIREIQTVSLPLYPTRMLCVSDDGTIRLIAAETGEVITTFILEEGKRTKWVDYCLPWETLFVLTEEGEVLRINTLTNPATLLKQGARPRSVGGSPVDAATTESGLGKRKAKACCLVVYNYIVDPEKAFSCWTEVVENGGEKRKRKPKEIKQERNRYMLIVGQEDGFLAVLDWYSGQIQYQTEAHSSQAVTGLVTNLENNYIISAGGDRSVKAWRVFPYAEESLSLQVTFFCGQPPLRISVMDSLLAVAFQDFSSATYSIVQFNLLTKRRTDHSPNDDPQDKITGLCTCPRMKIFASSSLDGIIRIWDRDNGLIRQRKAPPLAETERAEYEEYERELQERAEIPDVDLFDLNEALRSPRPPPPEAPYIPKTERGGFFPDHALARHSGPCSETEEYQTREKTPEQSFSKTMTLDSFMKQLMQQLKTKDYCVKTGILGAVQTLLQQEGLEITMDLHNLLLSILNQPNAPTLRDPDEREFIHAALTTLVSIAPHSKELLLEMMVQLILCDEVFRKRVESLWQKMDLEDPHDYLGQELSSWDEWPQGMGSAKTQLRKQTTDWLNHWIAKYKIESKSSDCKPIEAVNYFCSEQHKKWLVANRPPVSVPLEKNTVLLLPDIRRSHAILRLGETNSMARTRPVEYITLPPISSRPLLSGFVPYMAFPLPKVNLCPFTSPEDPAKPDPSCRFLGAAPRYFFLEHSYADNYK